MKRSTSQDKASSATEGSQHAEDVFLGHLFMYSNHLTEGKRERGIKMKTRKRRAWVTTQRRRRSSTPCPSGEESNGDTEVTTGRSRELEEKKLCRDTWPCRAPALPSE